ncbi:MAG: polyprenyl diphosphate synthase [Chlamydiota bacterium]
MDCTFQRAEPTPLATDLNDKECVPKHVAIIMDGNRRYAKKNNLPTLQGHWKGAETLIEIVIAAKDLGIKILTVFGFSTENWERSDQEVEALFEILRVFLISQRPRMLSEGVLLQSIGDIERFPLSLSKTLQETEQLTKGGTGITLVLALSYGGRDELTRSFKNLLIDYNKNKFTLDSIDESLIESYLDTKRWPDPDLLIRTSGEMRVSNFLIWQMAYSELYFTEVLWPEFLPRHLQEAVSAFQKRSRRKGK